MNLRRFGELPSRLHKGEAACLAIAEHRHWTLLTDDGARGWKLPVAEFECPALSVVSSVIERGLATLEQANDWLSEMIRLDYRSPITDITPLLKRQ